MDRRDCVVTTSERDGRRAAVGVSGRLAGFRRCVGWYEVGWYEVGWYEVGW